MDDALGAEKGERTPERLGYRSGYYSAHAGDPGRQARAARAAGPGGPLLDRAVRALPALRAGAGGDLGRDVRAGRLDPEGQGDHRGAVRPRLLGLGHLRHQQAAGREPRRLCRAPPRRALPLPHPRRPLREGARRRRGDEPGGADRHRHRLGRTPPDPRRRDGQPREPLILEGLPARPAGARPQRRRVRRRRRSRRPARRHPRGAAEAAFQRCYVHFLRNALDHLPRKADDDCLQELRWLYDRRDLAEARADLAAWIAKWQGRYPKLTDWVEETIEETSPSTGCPASTTSISKAPTCSNASTRRSGGEPMSCASSPTHDSCLRLVRALAVETHENWLEANRYLNMDDLREHKKIELRQAA